MPSIHEWIECRTGDGTPLPVEACDHYRSIKGLPPIERALVPGGSQTEAWNHGKPSRGVGDVIAKFARSTGLDKVAESVAKATGAKGCGCKARQEKLNEMFPFKGASE